jgi:sulfur carrier protein
VVRDSGRLSAYHAGVEAAFDTEEIGTEMAITVNGAPMDWREGMTVADILEARNYIFRMIAVQVNGELVPRGTYKEAAVPDGADVQVIHMISGG